MSPVLTQRSAVASQETLEASSRVHPLPGVMAAPASRITVRVPSKWSGALMRETLSEFVSPGDAMNSTFENSHVGENLWHLDKSNSAPTCAVPPIASGVANTVQRKSAISTAAADARRASIAVEYHAFASQAAVPGASCDIARAGPAWSDHQRADSRTARRGPISRCFGACAADPATVGPRASGAGPSSGDACPSTSCS